MNKKVYCKQCGSECKDIMDGHIQRVGCTKCSFIYYQNPYPCVSVLVVNEKSEVLLGLRGKDSIYKDQWCLPCGYIEYDESFVEAAIRETKEETGVSIEPMGIINVVSNKLNEGVHSLVIVILAKPLSQHAVAGDDLVKVAWVSLNAELPELAFEADEHIIKKYKEATLQNQILDYIDLTGTSF